MSTRARVAQGALLAERARQRLQMRRAELTAALDEAQARLALAAAGAAAWSGAEVARLRGRGRPVLVNFAAAWCISCKVNERVALDRERVRAALARHDVAYLKADWTRHDPVIMRELERHGRSGVPLYLLYPAHDGDPRVLPQPLTEGLVLQSIDDIL